MQVVIKNQIWVTEAEICVKLGINSYFLRKKVEAREVTQYKREWLNVYVEGNVVLCDNEPIEIIIKDERWYIPDDFSKRLGVSRESVRRWTGFGFVLTKKIGSIRLVKFHPHHVTIAQTRQLEGCDAR